MIVVLPDESGGPVWVRFSEINKTCPPAAANTRFTFHHGASLAELMINVATKPPSHDQLTCGRAIAISGSILLCACQHSQTPR